MLKRNGFIFRLLIIFLQGISLCIASSSSVKYINGINIYSQDGTKISANVYMPNTKEHATKKWPLIIMPNSWDLNEYEYTIPARKMAKRGYIVLSYSARGWGKSGGRVDAGGPNDLADIDAIIKWALSELPSDSKNIGMAGISYGGGLSLLAAAHDSRIKAVAVMSAWSDLIYALYGNKSPSVLWGGVLVKTGKLFGRLEPKIETNYQNLVKHHHVSDAKQWAKTRSPSTYIDGINGNKTAVYISQNLEDRLFKANMMIKFYSQLHTKKRMDFNQGIHGSAEAPGLFGFDNYVWTQAVNWLDKWLKNTNNNIDKAPLFSVELRGGKRLRFTQWPLDSHTERFYLQKSHMFNPGALTKDIQNSHDTDKLRFGLITGVNSGIPILSPILEPYKLTPIISWLPGINRLSAIYYKSKPLTHDRTIIGIPKIKLWYKSSRQKSQLIAYLYDVDSFGMGRLISHAAVSRYHDIPGNYVFSEFDLSMSAYSVPKGHSIALAFGMFDILYRPPSLSNYTIDLAYGTQMPSGIDIPFVT
jgi:predicted acyl esterase